MCLLFVSFRKITLRVGFFCGVIFFGCSQEGFFEQSESLFHSQSGCVESESIDYWSPLSDINPVEDSNNDNQVNDRTKVYNISTNFKQIKNKQHLKIFYSNPFSRISSLEDTNNDRTLISLDKLFLMKNLKYSDSKKLIIPKGFRNYVYQDQILMQPKFLNSPRLSDKALHLLKYQGISKFFDKCGHHYITATQQGWSLTMIIETEYKELKEQEQQEQNQSASEIESEIQQQDTVDSEDKNQPSKSNQQYSLTSKSSDFIDGVFLRNIFKDFADFDSELMSVLNVSYNIIGSGDQDHILDLDHWNQFIGSAPRKNAGTSQLVSYQLRSYNHLIKAIDPDFSDRITNISLYHSIAYKLDDIASKYFDKVLEIPKKIIKNKTSVPKEINDYKAKIDRQIELCEQMRYPNSRCIHPYQSLFNLDLDIFYVESRDQCRKKDGLPIQSSYELVDDNVVCSVNLKVQDIIEF